MAKKIKRAPKLKSSKDVLTVEQLTDSRVAQINGSNLLFLVSPQVMQNKSALRHLTFVTRAGKENVLADGKLRAKFWSLSFFDPSDWHAKFRKMDEILAAFIDRREDKASQAA